RVLAHSSRQRARIRDGFAVDRGNHVVRLQLGSGGWTVFDHLDYLGARGDVALRCGNDRDTQYPVGDFAVFNQLLSDPLCVFHWNSKAKTHVALGTSGDRHVDPNETAFLVNEGAT